MRFSFEKRIFLYGCLAGSAFGENPVNKIIRNNIDIYEKQSYNLVNKKAA